MFRGHVYSEFFIMVCVFNVCFKIICMYAVCCTYNGACVVQCVFHNDEYSIHCKVCVS